LVSEEVRHYKIDNVSKKDAKFSGGKKKHSSHAADSKQASLKNLDKQEKRVAAAFCEITGREIKTEDVPFLREALTIAPADGIIAGMKRTADPKKVRSFKYFMQQIRRGAFGRLPKFLNKKEVQERGLERYMHTKYADVYLAAWESSP